MRVHWKAALGATLLALPVALASGAGDEEWDAPTKKWIKGPVSYLATDEEEKEFKKTTDEQREAFIAEFWARRDPTPDTPENRFRERFFARVEAADAILKGQGIPAGWKSEPGRVLILLGQPDDFKRESLDSGPSAEDDSAPSRYGGGAGIGETPSLGGDTTKLVLDYNDLTRLGLPANLELEFRGDGHTFRLMTRVNLATDAIRGLDAEFLTAEFPAGAATEKKLTLESEAPSQPAVAAAAPLDMTVPQRILTDALDQDLTSDAVPVETTIDFYKTLAGRTYVAITLGLDGSAVEDADRLHPVAALRDVNDPDNLFLYDSDDLFAPADGGDDDGLLRFQAGDGVAPGTYKAAFGFIDDDGTRYGIQTREIEVPDYEEPGVRLSSLTLAGHLETTTEDSSDLKRPYILGNRKVIPKVQPNYSQDGTLTVYYQVYNATEGDDGNPNLRISYKVYQKRGTRFVRAAVVPPMDGVTSRVQIYELQITQAWRPGDYKLKVTVEDNVGGTFAEEEVVFHVG